MIVFWVMLGAISVTLTREWVEWRMRVAHKRRNCIHDFEVIKHAGTKTNMCKRCGYQEFIYENKKDPPQKGLD